MVETTRASMGTLMPDLKFLPPEVVHQVMGFIEFLHVQYAYITPTSETEALLVCWGTWHFTPDEREELDTYIQAMQEMSDDRLPA